MIWRPVQNVANGIVSVGNNPGHEHEHEQRERGVPALEYPFAAGEELGERLAGQINQDANGIDQDAHGKVAEEHKSNRNADAADSKAA